MKLVFFMWLPLNLARVTKSYDNPGFYKKETIICRCLDQWAMICEKHIFVFINKLPETDDF